MENPDLLKSFYSLEIVVIVIVIIIVIEKNNQLFLLIAEWKLRIELVR